MYQIFTSFNERYRIVAAACIASLFKHTDPDVEIIILDTGIKKRTKNKFQNWAKRKNRILQFLVITTETYKHFLGSDIVLPTNIEYYPRLIAPYFSKNNFEKILYIDADIVCLRNPKKIFEVNLNENIIGAIQDQYLHTIFNGIINYDKIGLEKDVPYFNSGVILIDVNKWKSTQISRQVILTTAQNKEYVLHWDQYALNIVLYNKWQKLNFEWNEMHSINDSQTIFRHFAGTKPLSPSFTANDANLFFAFLKLSPFHSIWWEKILLRLFIAKCHWKLKFYCNKIFNTNFLTETLNV